MIAPVSRLEASEARNCTTDAISCGWPMRPAGAISSQRDTSPAWVSSPLSSGVSVIIVSTDTDELVRAVDRVCVFEQGAIKETLTDENITVERLRASVQA